MDDSRFGIILLENPFVRREDVERCLQIQSLGGWRKPIGQILLEEGVITQATLDLVLSIQDNRRRRKTVQEPDAEAADGALTLSRLVELAASRRASDLLLAVGRRPRARVAGRIQSLARAPITQAWMEEALGAVLSAAELERVQRQKMLVTRLSASPGGRLTVYLDCSGPAAMLRLQPAGLPALESLGLPSQVISLLDSRRGLLLVSGGPRSGKSTTLSAMVEHIARRGAAHVVVLDEHHDFSFSDVGGLISRLRVRPQRDELARALRAAFREDPNVIVVGDLGGAESIELCMQLASTGHLVIAGVTASGTIAALQGLETGVADSALPQFRGNLASELLAVVHQELVPDTRGGLVPAREVVRATKAFRRAVAEGSFERIPILLSFEADQGSIGLDECLMDLVESGTIALDEAFARARDQHRFLMTAG